MRLITVFCILLIAVMYTSAVHGRERTLTILYTGSLQGELEPCGCSPKTDFGGVARLSGYLSQHKKGLSPYLMIDAGNFAGDDTPQGRLKTETMLKAFGMIGYDAVAFRKRETALSPDFLSPLSDKNRIRAVYESPYFTKTVFFKKDTLPVNVGTNPEKSDKGKLNILLTDHTVSEAKLFSGWDLIILSSGEILDEPVKTEQSIIVAGYPKGKKLGILTLDYDAPGKLKILKHRWQELGTDVKEDPSVRRVLNEYDSRVAALFKAEQKPIGEATYLGAEKCEECHQPFVEIWNKTRHAKAFASLEKNGKAADPECIICHSAGFGEEGGFFSIASTPALANVQCESCHGPGREHIADQSAPLKPAAENTCLKCHTKDQSPDFNYQVYLEKIKHW